MENEEPPVGPVWAPEIYYRYPNTYRAGDIYINRDDELMYILMPSGRKDILLSFSGADIKLLCERFDFHIPELLISFGFDSGKVFKWN